MLVSKVVATTPAKRGSKKVSIETVFDAVSSKMYLRVFLGKGRKEVCFKTLLGDVDLLKFADQMGFTL